MTMHITTRTFNQQDTAAVVHLIEQEDTGLHEKDGRLRPPRSAEVIQTFLATNMLENAVVAVDATGKVRAFAIPGVWEIAEDDEMSGFFLPRNGTVKLTLPPADEPEATAVAHALLDAVEAWWQAQPVDGSLITRPTADDWLAQLLTQRGYVTDSTAAARPLHPLPPLPESDTIIRPAQPQDEEILVALHLEEIRFHEEYTPYSRIVPAIEPAFRQRLARLWRGDLVEDGAPLLLVAEQAGQVIGFTENWLSPMQGSWFKNGRYAYLNSVGVSEAARGKGIGRLLVAHTLTQLAQYDIAGFYLYYVLANPLSSIFWPKMGFQPLLTTYKTMHERTP